MSTGAVTAGKNPYKHIPSDIEIAQAARMKPIVEVAKDLGIGEKHIELYGL